MDSSPGTPEGDELDILTTLVEAYERQKYPLDPPDSAEAIRFYMERNDLTPKDLDPGIGRLNMSMKS